MSMISDLVYRLRKESKSMGKYGTDYMATLLMQASDTIIMLSEKARADRPQGEWKHLKGDEWLCSNCGYVVWTEGSWEHPLERGKDYCEHCGARMKGERKDNEF